MVVLTIVSRVVLELFQPQRVPGRLRLQLVRSREAEQEAVEAEEEKEEEKEEEEEEEQRGGGTTEAEAAPEQPGRAPASLGRVGKCGRTYGSVSAGREKWPFNVLFFLK